ncbi:chemotaxis protein CheW [Candidatus Reidiella endopervernicosa]|uniref:Purine-binding chemotaxis protein CheW n=1 Tax=Candidatus Reidiella endopervernicosa TaxID=2738883 RepID=A0A6N0HXN5_9GAMM|nr:chemotaxis protein CheW [Candidatus Reidiella endopervernicosa]QKQ26946.1 purine-binding chemotaxis protein CheW [Candidatus Reidiella endopervernicosa]
MEAANENRFELLLFHLGSKQRYGINVLKVKEVIGCPELTHVPESHPAVRGVSHLRGETLTIIDLSQSVGLAPLPESEDVDASVIVSEFNRVMIGFLVSKVDRIAVCDWKDVLPPPKGSGLGSYITGVTDIEKELVQILDVERIIGEVVGSEVVTAADLSLDGNQAALLEGKRILSLTAMESEVRAVSPDSRRRLPIRS